MPLRALVESLHTLTRLIEQSRTLRNRDDLSPGAVENVDTMIDETLETADFLLQTVVNAHTRGDLDATLKSENAEIELDSVEK